MKIKPLALRNFYCEIVFLSVRLMKMSANEMKFCQMELLSPQVQLGKGVNLYINLISIWENGFETSHFWFSLGKTEKIIILKIHITNIILPSHSTSSAKIWLAWMSGQWKGRWKNYLQRSWTFSGVFNMFEQLFSWTVAEILGKSLHV